MICGIFAVMERTNFAYEVIYQKMPPNQFRPKGTWLDLSLLEPLATRRGWAELALKATPLLLCKTIVR